jgi:hypothetical protein
VSFVAITLCVASQRVFNFVVYFVIDSIRKLLDTPSYWRAELEEYLIQYNSMSCYFKWAQGQYGFLEFRIRNLNNIRNKNKSHSGVRKFDSRSSGWLH